VPYGLRAAVIDETGGVVREMQGPVAVEWRDQADHSQGLRWGYAIDGCLAQFHRQINDVIISRDCEVVAGGDLGLPESFRFDFGDSFRYVLSLGGIGKSPAPSGVKPKPVTPREAAEEMRRQMAERERVIAAEEASGKGYK